MELLDKLGISYKAGYLVQGNQIERLNTSKKLNIVNTELMLRTDGKDSNIDSIFKCYKGNIVFHLPSINPDLSNLDVVNKVVRTLKNYNVKLITIDASNLLMDLFEWSTNEEQKKYFLNVVTAIATIASNKVEIAIQNLKEEDEDKKYGYSMEQVTDILIYSRNLLVKDFGFKEEDAQKYIGISLNIDNINMNNKKESITNYLEVLNKYIKCIKFTNLDNLNAILDFIENKDIPIFMQTKTDLDEIDKEYNEFIKRVEEYLDNNGIKPIKTTKPVVKNNDGYSNIIIFTMVVLTIVIVVLMFMVKLR